MTGGYIYILGSLSGTLYIGVTSNLDVRVMQHKEGTFKGFAFDHHCNRLLYYERYEDIARAIAREKQLKGWSRSKKLDLIHKTNPRFDDLSQTLGWKLVTKHESIVQ
jgi:putative endonuclease